MDSYTDKCFNTLTFTESYNLIQQLHEKLVFLGLNNHLSIDTRFYFHFESGTEVRKNLIYIEGRVESNQEEKYNELKTYINGFGFKPSEENGIMLESLIYKQDNISKIENLINVKTGEPAEFTANPEEVVNMLVWTSANARSVKLLVAADKEYEKHTEWKGKAKMVALSIDEDIEEVKKCVKKNKFENIDHYYLPGGYNHEFMKSLDITTTPKYILLSKDNASLEYICNPFTTDYSLVDDNENMIQGISSVIARKNKQLKRSLLIINIIESLFTHWQRDFF